MEEKTKDETIKKETNPTPAIPTTAKPKKRSCGCWVVFAIILVILFWSFVIRNFFPFMFYAAVGGFDSSELPDLKEIESTANITPIDEATTGGSNRKKSTASSSPTSPAPTDTSSTESANSGTTEPAPTFLDAYIDLANKSIGGSEMTTKRWVKSKVYIGGREADDALDATYRTCLDWFVADFNTNSGNVKLERNAELADIKIYFMPTEELRTRYETLLPFNIPSSNQNGEMTGSDIVMPNDTDWLDDEKCWSLKHEIIHAIGFPGHTNKVSNSEMSYNPLYITYAGLSSSDQRIIRMLYNSGVPLLTSEQQVRNFFNTHTY
jgi:hypothetical protein